MYKKLQNMNCPLTQKTMTHFKPKDASYEVRGTVARGHILRIGTKDLKT